ncbi:MAG: cytochrome c [Vicinamibacterales bacterium]
MKIVRALWHGLAVVGLATLVGAAWFASRGIGSRESPGPIETSVSRAARHFLIPAAARARTSPTPFTDETLQSGLEHWADHCASCHGNDGSGQTAMGQGLYPKAPDMRLAESQSLSDGELFYIIEHGVKITGMPAWGTGTPAGEAASWHLVQFIRRLPALTDDELARMEELNPRGRADWLAYEEERRFLSGTLDLPDGAPVAPGHSH